MARLDVYPTPIAEHKRHTPYWLDVQANHLESLGTRVIVPLRRVVAGEPLKERLNPEFSVERVHVFADVANLGVFPTRLLRKPVARLSEHRLAIDDALDFLFTGY